MKHGDRHLDLRYLSILCIGFTDTLEHGCYSKLSQPFNSLYWILLDNQLYIIKICHITYFQFFVLDSWGRASLDCGVVERYELSILCIGFTCLEEYNLHGLYLRTFNSLYWILSGLIIQGLRRLELLSILCIGFIGPGRQPMKHSRILSILCIGFPS